MSFVTPEPAAVASPCPRAPHEPPDNVGAALVDVQAGAAVASNPRRHRIGRRSLGFRARRWMDGLRCLLPALLLGLHGAAPATRAADIAYQETHRWSQDGRSVEATEHTVWDCAVESAKAWCRKPVVEVTSQHPSLHTLTRVEAGRHTRLPLRAITRSPAGDTLLEFEPVDSEHARIHVRRVSTLRALGWSMQTFGGVKPSAGSARRVAYTLVMPQPTRLVVRQGNGATQTLSPRRRVTFDLPLTDAGEAPVVTYSEVKPLAQWAAVLAAPYRPMASPTGDGILDELSNGRRPDASELVVALAAWMARTLRPVGPDSWREWGDAYTPASVERTVGNGRGDCKAYVLLARSVLAAGGVDSFPAFVSAARPPDGIFDPASVDHVVLYVPALGVYFDPTHSGYLRVGRHDKTSNEPTRPVLDTFSVTLGVVLDTGD